VDLACPITAQIIVATITDISRTGVRLGCDVMLSVGQQVGFKVENIVAAANVIWSDRGSCALEFDTPIAISEVQQLRWRGLESVSG